MSEKDGGPLTVLLIVTGSIAAYKSIEVARLLKKMGHRVVPIQTHSSERFVGPSLLAGVTGEQVHREMWAPSTAGELHVDLARAADVVAVVPATADFLARMAHGRADDLASALVLCTSSPVIVAPAMHPRMWAHRATRANMDTLGLDSGVHWVGPVFGEVASGEKGMGRMADPEAIVNAILATQKPKDFAGRRVLVTAGPTIEDLDPVRFLGNRSSGTMGFALAERAARRGASTTLIAGPVNLPRPHGVTRVDVRSALDMQRALGDALGADLSGSDVLIMAAAVADYRPREQSHEKLKKSGESLTINLVKNPDLLAEIGAQRGSAKKPLLVGFAVESSTRLLDYARSKRVAKQCDVIVANEASVALGTRESQVVVIDGERETPIGPANKGELADRILDHVASQLRKAESKP